MNLPTTGQVAAATRHVASFAAGVILAFGLSTKINADQVTAVVNSIGALVSDVVVLIGIVTPVIAGWMASRSASPAAQINAVIANPDNKLNGTIETTKEIAAAVPSNQVIAK